MKELTKYCPNCGKQNKDTAKFCEECGSNLNNATNASEPKEETESSSGGIMGFWNKQSTKGKAAIGLVGLCCIGLILVVAISGMMAPDKTTTNTVAQASNSATPDSSSSTTPTSNSASDTSSSSGSGIQVQVSYAGSWSGSYGDESGQQSADGSGAKTFDLTSDNPSIVSADFQKNDGGSGTLTVEIIKDGSVLQSKSTSAQYGVASVSASV